MLKKKNMFTRENKNEVIMLWNTRSKNIQRKKKIFSIIHTKRNLQERVMFLIVSHKQVNSI